MPLSKPPAPSKPAPKQDSQNQGEGDRTSARRFNEAERDFVESDEGRAAIRNGPAPANAAEEKAMRDAETQAAKRAHVHDPAEKHNHKRPSR